MNEFNETPTPPSPRVEAVARVLAERWYLYRNIDENDAADFAEQNWGLFLGDARACVSAVWLQSWKKIEIAPKDGTLVDLWVSNPDDPVGHRVVDCLWSYGKWCVHNDEGDLESATSGSPTHWMLTPSEPIREMVAA